MSEKKTERKRKRNLPSFWPVRPLTWPSPTHQGQQGLLPLPTPPRSSLERPSTPWTPPRRLRASRPPQDSKVRHGDALDSLSHFPHFSLPLELSAHLPPSDTERPAVHRRRRT